MGKFATGDLEIRNRVLEQLKLLKGKHRNQDILSGQQHQCKGVAIFRRSKNATKSQHTTDHM